MEIGRRQFLNATGTAFAALVTACGGGGGSSSGSPAPTGTASARPIGYGALVDAMNRMLAHLSPEQRDRFFWKNAKAFYRL